MRAKNRATSRAEVYLGWWGRCAEVGRLEERCDVRIQSVSPPASLRGTSADRRHHKRLSRCMFRAGDDDGA
eukprot:7271295-Prymnesium_polylepis.1